MVSNPFDNLTYFVIDFDSIPSGWSHQEKRNSRKRVNRGVGQQSNAQSHLNTWHRKDAPTVFDEDDNLTQTAGKVLYRLDALNYANEDELIDAVIAEIADELGKTINAVTQKVEVTIIGGQQDALDYLVANKVAWGE